MSAEQVLRCIVVKLLFGFTYEDLAFHMVDSQSLRWFCRIGMAEEGFRKSALNRNIKTISSQTWEMINGDILGYVKQEGIEKGRKVLGYARAIVKAIKTAPLHRAAFCCWPISNTMPSLPKKSSAKPIAGLYWTKKLQPQTR